MATAPLRRLNAFDGYLPMAEPEDASEGQPLQPKIGDRIMVVRQPWLDKILDGSKTMELRARKASVGFVWLGMGGTIYGRAKIASSVALTPVEFRAREAEHQWPTGEPIPYGEAPWGLILEQVTRLPTPLPYWRPPCAIGWNVYRTAAADLPMKTSSANKAKKRKNRNDDEQGASPPEPALAPPLEAVAVAQADA
jgi:hypothetical protein